MIHQWIHLGFCFYKQKWLTNMRNPHHFQSIHYQPIRWSDIVADACDSLIKTNVEIIDWKNYLVNPLNFANNNKIANKELFKLLIKQVVMNTYRAINTIYIYTHEHLNSRQYGDKKLIHLSSVQNQWVNTMVVLQTAEVMLDTNDTVELFYCIDLLVEVLHLLSVLAGARAIFKNHSIELMYHLTLFQKFSEEVL